MNYATRDEILKDVYKLIKYYASHVNGEDTEQELLLFVLNLYEDGKCKSKPYVAASLKNKYIEISKVNQNIISCEIELQDYFFRNVDSLEFQEMDIRLLLELLPKKQKEVICLHFFYGYSIDEIAKQQNTTRQAVNGIKQRALKKIKFNCNYENVRKNAS